jgi:hypothetical protein
MPQGREAALLIYILKYILPLNESKEYGIQERFRVEFDADGKAERLRRTLSTRLDPSEVTDVEFADVDLESRTWVVR